MEGIIEPSNSPWRAQVVVTKDESHKKRLAIDYSQTINRFILLDAIPLLRINDLLNDIAQYRVFSTIDLRSVYHQVPLKEEDKQCRLQNVLRVLIWFLYSVRAVLEKSYVISTFL